MEIGSKYDIFYRYLYYEILFAEYIGSIQATAHN